LIKNAFLVSVEKREFLDASERFRHEWLREVEALLSADDVLNAPMNDF
jgi:hypothetical protein